ncbi:MAG: aminoacyltransferase [Streptococcaceae bacterium]|nr:aminoacyltransferase [Streptococcaceae bacterium]
MNFTTLTQEEFLEYSLKNTGYNFMQSLQMKTLREKRGWQVEFVGMKENGKVVLSTLLAKMPAKLGYYYEIDGGFLGDYTNKQLVTTFIHSLKEYMKNNGGLYLSMTPDFVYQQRTWSGETIGEAQKEVFQTLTQAGMVHQGFDIGFSAKPRWIFVKDLSMIADEKSLQKTYQKDAQYSVKRSKGFGITIRNLAYEELSLFKTLTEHTAKRRGFEDKTLEYYQQAYQSFGEDAKFVVAEINFATYIASLEKKVQELEQKLIRIARNLEKTPNSSKMLNQQREFQEQLQTQEKRIKEAQGFKEESGDQEVILAGGLFIFNHQEVIYLFSGTYDKYKNFYAPFLIQDTMMTLALEKGIKRYNFFGINGQFDGSDGVLKFKQSFTGQVEEKMGTFNLIVSPLKYKLYQLMHQTLGKLRG